MNRMLFRASIALVTFVLGVAATVIYGINTARPTIPTVQQRVEITFTPYASACYPGRSVETHTLAKASYFPPKALSENDWGDQFQADWFSSHLMAMKEEPLHTWDDGSLETFRFLWLRSFHHPVAVRIWKCGSVKFITVKEMSGAGGYEPGNLIVNKERELTTDEWNEFIRLFDKLCFWQLSTPDEITGTDGAQWIFEAVRGGRYHIVNRWSPRGGSYRELCLYLLKLSRLKIDTSSDEMY